MRLPKALKRFGLRRATFIAFCVAAVAAGWLYLRSDAHAVGRDFGFGKSLPPAMGLFAVLAAASPWLVPKGRLPALSKELAPRGDWNQRTGFWAGAALAMVCATVIWGQRLDSSLWTDEVTSMRENIVGRWKHRNNGEGYLKRPTLSETFFEYKTRNNHSLYSATARWTHDRLAGINDSDFTRPYFNETALRFPALVAALLSLPLVGYLALRLGSLLAAWLAMSWAVLHPWYLELSTSARGYTFAMFFLALAVVAAVRIFRRGGGWRWWVAYGLGQFLAFFSVPTVAHALVLMNIAVFAGMLFDSSVAAKSRRKHLGAFFAVNIAAVGFAFVTFMPKHAQFKEYLATDHFSSEMAWEWMEDCMSNFFIGQPFLTWSDDNPWAFATDQWPAAFLVLAILIVLASLVMFIRHSWRGGVFTSLLGLAMILPPFTVYLQAHAMQFYFFPWYSSWQLPLWLTLFSIGAAAGIIRLCKSRPKWVPVTATLALIIAIGIATHHQRDAFLSVAVEQQRESAALMRSSPNPYAPGHEEVITISIVTANHAYDPWNRRIRSMDDLWEQIAFAEETGRPLFCDTAWNPSAPPGAKDLLMNPQYFEHVVDPLPGLQVQNTRHVLKYIPGSLKEKLAERAAD